MKKANELMKGFRTIIVSWLGYSLMFVDYLFTNLAGLNHDALKGAAAMALLITIKQVWTDVLPKLKGKLKK